MPDSDAGERKRMPLCARSKRDVARMAVAALRELDAGAASAVAASAGAEPWVHFDATGARLADDDEVTGGADSDSGGVSDGGAGGDASRDSDADGEARIPAWELEAGAWLTG